MVAVGCSRTRCRRTHGDNGAPPLFAHLPQTLGPPQVHETSTTFVSRPYAKSPHVWCGLSISLTIIYLHLTTMSFVLFLLPFGHCPGFVIALLSGHPNMLEGVFQSGNASASLFPCPSFAYLLIWETSPTYPQDPFVSAPTSTAAWHLSGWPTKKLSSLFVFF